MSKKKIKHIYDPIFRQNYYWVVVKSFQEFQRIVKKELKIDIEDSKKEEKYGVSLLGRVEYIEREACRIPLIWFANLKPPLVIHECWHAVYDSLSSKGVYVNDDTEEVYAYVLDFLVENILGR